MKNYSAKRIAYTGLMMALVAALSFLEHVLLPPFPGLPPGASIGLTNILIMYFVFFSGWRWALTVAVHKAGMAFLLRGATAGLLSLCGGLLSLLVILCLLAVFKERISYAAISVSGAVAHNLGQLCVVAIIYATPSVFGYLPLLVISGVAAGTATGVMLRILIPVLKRTFPAEDS